MLPSWLSPDPASPAHALIRVRAQPGARRTALVGLWNGCLKLAVSAPPDDGRANAALAELLAELLGLAPSRVELSSGARQREKRFRVRLPPESVHERLAPHLARTRS
jgi:uncharacterized protein (TIGR00251 family)